MPAIREADRLPSLPYEFGTIEEYEATSSISQAPSVIHIQDAHASPEAQQNITNILKWLAKDHPLLIALEGALGPLHPEYLDFFPRYPRVNDAMVQDLVQEGILSGSELYSWERYQQPSRGKSTFFTGVETPRFYRANLRAYRIFFKDESSITREFQRLRRSLESAQVKILHPELRKFIREVEQKKEGRYDSGIDSPNLYGYVHFLADASLSHLKIDLRDRFEQIRFPHLTRLLFLMEFEKKLYPRQRRILQSEIQTQGLSQEMALLETGIREKLIRNDSERTLLGILDDFRLLERLFRLQVTREEYQKIVRRQIEITPQNLEKRLTVVARRPASGMLPRNDDKTFLTSSFQIALDFYRLAERRDLLLLGNALKEAKEMEKRSGTQPIVVLITGGFHTSGLTALMKQKNIPYAVVTPRITKGDFKQTRYHELMMGKTSHLALARLLVEVIRRAQLVGPVGKREQRRILLSRIGRAETREYLQKAGLSRYAIDRVQRESLERFNQIFGAPVSSRAEVRAGREDAYRRVLEKRREKVQAKISELRQTVDRMESQKDERLAKTIQNLEIRITKLQERLHESKPRPEIGERFLLESVLEEVAEKFKEVPAIRQKVVALQAELSSRDKRERAFVSRHLLLREPLFQSTSPHLFAPHASLPSVLKDLKKLHRLVRHTLSVFNLGAKWLEAGILLVGDTPVPVTDEQLTLVNSALERIRQFKLEAYERMRQQARLIYMGTHLDERAAGQVESYLQYFLDEKGEVQEVRHVVLDWIKLKWPFSTYLRKVTNNPIDDLAQGLVQEGDHLDFVQQYSPLDLVERKHLLFELPENQRSPIVAGRHRFPYSYFVEVRGHLATMDFLLHRLESIPLVERKPSELLTLRETFDIRDTIRSLESIVGQEILKSEGERLVSQFRQHSEEITKRRHELYYPRAEVRNESESKGAQADREDIRIFNTLLKDFEAHNFKLSDKARETIVEMIRSSPALYRYVAILNLIRVVTHPLFPDIVVEVLRRLSETPGLEEALNKFSVPSSSPRQGTLDSIRGILREIVSAKALVDSSDEERPGMLPIYEIPQLGGPAESDFIGVMRWHGEQEVFMAEVKDVVLEKNGNIVKDMVQSHQVHRYYRTIRDGKGVKIGSETLRPSKVYYVVNANLLPRAGFRGREQELKRRIIKRIQRFLPMGVRAENYFSVVYVISPPVLAPTSHERDRMSQRATLQADPNFQQFLSGLYDREHEIVNRTRISPAKRRQVSRPKVVPIPKMIQWAERRLGKEEFERKWKQGGFTWLVASYHEYLAQEEQGKWSRAEVRATRSLDPEKIKLRYEALISAISEDQDLSAQPEGYEQILDALKQGDIRIDVETWRWFDAAQRLRAMRDEILKILVPGGTPQIAQELLEAIMTLKGNKLKLIRSFRSLTLDMERLSIPQELSELIKNRVGKRGLAERFNHLTEQLYGLPLQELLIDRVSGFAGSVSELSDELGWIPGVPLTQLGQMKTIILNAKKKDILITVILHELGLERDTQLWRELETLKRGYQLGNVGLAAIIHHFAMLPRAEVRAEFEDFEGMELLQHLPELNDLIASGTLPENELSAHIKLRRDKYVPAVRSTLNELAGNLLYELPKHWELLQAVTKGLGHPELYHQHRSLPLPILRLIDKEAAWERVASDNHVAKLLYLQKKDFDAYMSRPVQGPPVAYFSAEFGLHSPDPASYSGGLGILSGDHIRGASDLAMDLVGVGLLYEKGYFRQMITRDGRQIEYETRDLNREDMPLEEVKWPGTDKPMILEIPFPNNYSTHKSIKAKVWRLHHGLVSLLLLDTHIPENAHPNEKAITGNLYRDEPGTWPRMEQYHVLGVGGMMALKALGMDQRVIHLNDGHPVFAFLQALAQTLQELQGTIEDPQERFETAFERVWARTVFTTHTPVPSGNERFDPETVRPFLAEIFHGNRYAVDRLLSVGVIDDWEEGHWVKKFNLTAFAQRVSSHTNGVSELHGKVAQKMWKRLHPGMPVEKVPIPGIVNSVHRDYWQTPAMAELFRTTFEDEEVARVVEKQDRQELNQKISDDTWMDQHVHVDDEKLWSLHRNQKKAVFESAKRRFLVRFGKVPGDDLSDLGPEDQEYVKYLDSFDPEALTIGFARRIVDYKRTLLILDDLGRLEAISSKAAKPIQLIFAGKAHPQYEEGKKIIQELHQRMQELRKKGKVKIIFIEEYNMGLARRLEAGVDVWLNNPIRPMEASGTSGMKVVLNGGLNLSTKDGWAAQGIVHGRNGWLFGTEDDTQSDLADREALYRVLEKETIPLYDEPVKKNWIRMMKASVLSSAYYFGMARMLSEYGERVYSPAARAMAETSVEKAREQARLRIQKREEILAKFHGPERPSVKIERNYPKDVLRGIPISLHVLVDLKGLRPEDVGVDLMIHRADSKEDDWIWYGANDSVEEIGEGKYRYTIKVELPLSGDYEFKVRLTPRDQVSWRSSEELASVTVYAEAPQHIRAHDGELLDYRAGPAAPETGMLFWIRISPEISVEKVFWTSEATQWEKNPVPMERIGKDLWVVVVYPRAAPPAPGYYEFRFLADMKDGRRVWFTGDYQKVRRGEYENASLHTQHWNPFFQKDIAHNFLDEITAPGKGDPKAGLLQLIFEEVKPVGKINPQPGQEVRLGMISASFPARAVSDLENWKFYVHWGFEDQHGHWSHVKNIEIRPEREGDSIKLRTEFEVPRYEGEPKFKLVAHDASASPLQIVARNIKEWEREVIWSGERGKNHSFEKDNFPVRAEVRAGEGEYITKKNAKDYLQLKHYVRQAKEGVGRIIWVEGNFKGRNPQGMVQVAFLNADGTQRISRFTEWSLFPEEESQAFYRATDSEIEDYLNREKAAATERWEVHKKKTAERQEAQTIVREQQASATPYGLPLVAGFTSTMNPTYVAKFNQGVADRAKGEYHLGNATIVERKILFEILGSGFMRKPQDSETSIRVVLNRRKKQFLDKLKQILDKNGRLYDSVVAEAEQKILNPKDRSKAVLLNEWLKFRDPATGQLATVDDIKRWIHDAIPKVEKILKFEVERLGHPPFRAEVRMKEKVSERASSGGPANRRNQWSTGSLLEEMPQNLLRHPDSPSSFLSAGHSGGQMIQANPNPSINNRPNANLMGSGHLPSHTVTNAALDNNSTRWNKEPATFSLLNGSSTKITPAKEGPTVNEKNKENIDIKSISEPRAEVRSQNELEKKLNEAVSYLRGLYGQEYHMGRVFEKGLIVSTSFLESEAPLDKIPNLLITPRKIYEECPACNLDDETVAKVLMERFGISLGAIQSVSFRIPLHTSSGRRQTFHLWMLRVRGEESDYFLSLAPYLAPFFIQQGTPHSFLPVQKTQLPSGLRNSKQESAFQRRNPPAEHWLSFDPEKKKLILSLTQPPARESIPVGVEPFLAGVNRVVRYHLNEGYFVQIGVAVDPTTSHFNFSYRIAPVEWQKDVLVEKSAASYVLRVPDTSFQSLKQFLDDLSLDDFSKNLSPQDVNPLKWPESIFLDRNSTQSDLDAAARRHAGYFYHFIKNFSFVVTEPAEKVFARLKSWQAELEPVGGLSQFAETPSDEKWEEVTFSGRRRPRILPLVPASPGHSAAVLKTTPRVVVAALALSKELKQPHFLFALPVGEASGTALDFQYQTSQGEWRGVGVQKPGIVLFPDTKAKAFRLIQHGREGVRNVVWLTPHPNGEAKFSVTYRRPIGIVPAGVEARAIARGFSDPKVYNLLLQSESTPEEMQQILETLEQWEKGQVAPSEKGAVQLVQFLLNPERGLSGFQTSEFETALFHWLVQGAPRAEVRSAGNAQESQTAEEERLSQKRLEAVRLTHERNYFLELVNRLDRDSWLTRRNKRDLGFRLAFDGHGDLALDPAKIFEWNEPTFEAKKTLVQTVVNQGIQKGRSDKHLFDLLKTLDIEVNAPQDIQATKIENTDALERFSPALIPHSRELTLDVARRYAPLKTLVPQEIGFLTRWVAILPQNLRLAIFYSVQWWKDFLKATGVSEWARAYALATSQGEFIYFLSPLDPHLLMHEFIHKAQRFSAPFFHSFFENLTDLLTELENGQVLASILIRWKKSLTSLYGASELGVEFSAFFYEQLFKIETNPGNRQIPLTEAGNHWEPEVDGYLRNVNRQYPAIDKLWKAMEDFIQALLHLKVADTRARTLSFLRQHYLSLHPLLPLPRALERIPGVDDSFVFPEPGWPEKSPSYEKGKKRAADLLAKLEMSPKTAKAINEKLSEKSPFDWGYKEEGMREKTVWLNEEGLEGFFEAFQLIRTSGIVGQWSLAFHASNQEGRGDIPAYFDFLLDGVSGLEPVQKALQTLRDEVPPTADLGPRIQRDLEAIGFMEEVKTYLQNLAPASRAEVRVDFKRPPLTEEDLKGTSQSFQEAFSHFYKLEPGLFVPGDPKPRSYQSLADQAAQSGYYRAAGDYRFLSAAHLIKAGIRAGKSPKKVAQEIQPILEAAARERQLAMEGVSRSKLTGEMKIQTIGGLNQDYEQLMILALEAERVVRILEKKYKEYERQARRSEVRATRAFNDEEFNQVFEKLKEKKGKAPTVPELARGLGVAPHTVRTYVKNLKKEGRPPEISLSLTGPKPGWKEGFKEKPSEKSPVEFQPIIRKKVKAPAKSLPDEKIVALKWDLKKFLDLMKIVAEAKDPLFLTYVRRVVGILSRLDRRDKLTGASHLLPQTALMKFNSAASHYGYKRLKEEGRIREIRQIRKVLQTLASHRAEVRAGEEYRTLIGKTKSLKQLRDLENEIRRNNALKPGSLKTELLKQLEKKRRTLRRAEVRMAGFVERRRSESLRRYLTRYAKYSNQIWTHVLMNRFPGIDEAEIEQRLRSNGWRKAKVRRDPAKGVLYRYPKAAEGREGKKPRAEVRKEKVTSSKGQGFAVQRELNSTQELRKDSIEGKWAELQKQFASIIEDLANRAEVRRRLSGDGFLPPRLFEISIPQAEAAEAKAIMQAVQVGILNQNEDLWANRWGQVTEEKQQKDFRARIGLAATPSQGKEMVILGEEAAFQVGLLAAARAFGPNTEIGVVVSQEAYKPFVDDARAKLRSGQQLIVGEKLLDVLKEAAQRKNGVTRVSVYVGAGDPFVTRAEVRTLLRDPHIDIEIRTVTPQSVLHWARSASSELADQIEALRSEVRSLSVAA